ncbi:MAG: hypothetical protein PUE67_06810 [Oscillospiraceae bacterium]|nr:hypothetical protein [Oscillospiraceae bacterium]
MKDIKEPNFISKSTKKTLLLVVNVILIVALLAITTYAWFFRNLADNVDTEQIQFSAGLSLEVSLDNETYKNDITMVRGVDYSTSALTLELTGDGVPTNFKYPVLEKHMDNDTIKRPDVNAEWPKKSLAENVDYIHKTLYFRSTIPVDIYLTNSSYFKGISEIKPNSDTAAKPLVWTTTPSDAEKEEYRLVAEPDASGKYYSKDCVVGAVRAAFIDTTAKTTKLLWVPRPDIFCNFNIEKNKVAIEGPTEEKNDAYYKGLAPLSPIPEHAYKDYVPSPDTHWYYTIGSDGKYDKNVLNSTNQVEGGNYIVGTSELSSVDDASPKYGKIGTTTKANPNDKYYTTQVDLTIWIDGCDAEARKEFVGGKFSSKFQFVGISTGE